MTLHLACANESWRKGSIRNEFVLVGQWVEDEYAIRFGPDQFDVVSVLPDPSHIATWDSVPDGSWVQAKGMVFGTFAPEFHPSQLTRMVSDPSFSQHGIVDIDVDSWTNESQCVAGVSATGRKIEVCMPLGHRHARRRFREYMIQCRVRVSAKVYDTGISATEVISITPLSEIRTGLPRVLRECESLSEWSRSQAAKVKRPKGRSSISPRLRKEVFMRDGFRCCHCGVTPSDRRNVFLEVDHIVPVASGGGNDISNLQTLCSACNNGKSDQPDPLIATSQSSVIADPWRTPA